MASSRAASKRGLKASLVRVVVRARRAQRRAGAWRAFFPGRRPGKASGAPAAAPKLDPVDLVAIAIERLAPASFRCATLGYPVVVTVPDAETAAVFRAALARTGQHRATDRLLEIVVAGGR